MCTRQRRAGAGRARATPQGGTAAEFVAPGALPGPTEARNVASPAKLNLFLHVTGRRPDGYHLLETVFRLIDLADRMDFRLRTDGRIDLRTDHAAVAGPQNLALRAAHALRETAGVGLGVDIALRKRIPIGGGLGGGSSNAATTLLVLNRLWRLDWSRARLARLGLRLGADVPVFVGGRSAYARGIGDRLQPLALPQRWYVVLAPAVQVSTAEIFAAPELTRDTKPLRILGFSRQAGVLAGRNDLQPVVVRRVAAVARSLEALGDAAREFGRDRMVRMSGSGACVFCECDDFGLAQAIAARVRAAGGVGGATPGLGRVHVSRGIDENPVARWAAAQ